MVYALLSLSKKHAECHIIPVRGYTSLKVLVFFLHHPFRAVGISGEGASSNVLGIICPTPLFGIGFTDLPNKWGGGQLPPSPFSAYTLAL